jgi:hypothetical protein
MNTVKTPQMMAAPQQPGIARPMELIGLSPLHPLATQQGSATMPQGAMFASNVQAGTLTDILFDAVDVNNNGVIDRAEFRKAVRNDVIRAKPVSSPSSGASGDTCMCLKSFSS